MQEAFSVSAKARGDENRRQYLAPSVAQYTKSLPCKTLLQDIKGNSRTSRRFYSSARRLRAIVRSFNVPGIFLGGYLVRHPEDVLRLFEMPVA